MTNSMALSRLFLIGSAASQAKSPGLWNPVLQRLGTDWAYEPWDVPLNGDLLCVRNRLLEPDVVGANVTMPHKHWAAETADHATPEVLMSGACNLLLRRDSALHAHNTDISAVRALVGEGFQRHVLLMGAGGAARAVLVAIREQVGAVTITDRDSHATDELLAVAKKLGIDARAVCWEEAQGLAAGASLVVNATPIGKNASDAPVWGEGRLAPGALVYDFVYAPHVTASIARAREFGVRRIDGWDHLREQAVAMVALLGLEKRAYALLQESLELVRGH
ncbi:shikimate dehydrogenase [Arthrobacter alkaliphilus]|uniref:shikimate dehydrogenase family protein n=1 Tax=Arthrobacter alkaliphilus TaxID=369936 RepID=UPI001F1B0718|nr:shikimate dehydrogenase [Arthrobacter alkaliphilus]